MMKRACAAVLLLAISLAAQGTQAQEPRRLSAAEMQVLLSGHTAISTSGAPYRQYFDADGKTIYLPEGGQPDTGKWRIDAGRQQYCSWWQRGGWSCYEMFETGEGEIIWRSTGGRDYPARLVQGRQLER